MPFHLIDSIQRYVAISSIGTSTVRGRPSGTLDTARNFLATIKLRQLGVNQERMFQQRLDRLTKDLRAAAITFWVILFPDNEGQMAAFGFVQHNFFIFFNALIGTVFWRRAQRELFG